MRPFIPRQEYLRCGTVVTAGLTTSDEDVLNKLPSPWKENATNLLAKDPTKIDAPTLTSAKNMYNLFLGVGSDSPDYSTYQNAAKILKSFLHAAEPSNPLFDTADIFPTDTGAGKGIVKGTKLGIGTVIPAAGNKGNTKADPNAPPVPGALPAPPEPKTTSMWDSNVTKTVAIAGVALLAGVAIAKMA